MRLRRLCFEIFAFRLFFNEPIAEFDFCRCGSKHEALASSTIFLQDSIGLVGFEPTASWSRTRRSTKLSHSPKWNTYSGVRGGRATYFAYFSADSKEIESVSELQCLKRSESHSPESLSSIAFPLTSL